VGLQGEIGLVAIFPKQARIRAVGVEFRPARPSFKKGGREFLQVTEVRGTGCLKSSRGADRTECGGELASRRSPPGRPGRAAAVSTDRLAPKKHTKHVE